MFCVLIRLTHVRYAVLNYQLTIQSMRSLKKTRCVSVHYMIQFSVQHQTLPELFFFSVH